MFTPSWQWYSLVEMASSSRILHSATNIFQQWFWEYDHVVLASKFPSEHVWVVLLKTSPRSFNIATQIT